MSNWDARTFSYMQKLAYDYGKELALKEAAAEVPSGPPLADSFLHMGTGIVGGVAGGLTGIALARALSGKPDQAYDPYDWKAHTQGEMAGLLGGGLLGTMGGYATGQFLTR